MKNYIINSKNNLIVFVIFVISLIFVLFIEHNYIFNKNYKALQIKTSETARYLHEKYSNNDIFGSVSTLGIISSPVRNVLLGKINKGNNRAKLELENIKNSFKVALVYVLNRKGDVVLAVDYDDGKNLLGKNYNFRPYFQDALAGENVFYPALGVTTKKRGLYYASPVYRSGEKTSSIIGVIVIKMGLKSIDQYLSRISSPAFMVTPSGIIFSTNVERLLYHKIFREDEIYHKTKDKRQFANKEKKVSPELSISKNDKFIDFTGDKHALVAAPFTLNDSGEEWFLVVLKDTGRWFSSWIIILTILILVPVFIFIGHILRLNSIKKISEEELRKSRLRFKDIANVSSDWIWEVDSNWVYTYSSEKVKTILGYDVNEILGQTIFSFMDGKEANTLSIYLNGFMSNNQPVKDIEKWLITKDKRRICMLVNAIPLYDNIGNLTGYRGMEKDISEWKISEQRLYILKMAYEQSIDGIAITDPQGKIQYINKSWAGMHGYYESELIGSSIDIFHGNDLDDPEQISFNKAVSAFGSHKGEVRHLCKDGTVFPAFVSVTIIRDEDFNEIGSVRIVRNISGRKKIENELKQAKDDALEAIDTKSRYISAMSHEIRTPLSAVIGMTDLLMLEGLTPSQLDYLISIKESSNHLLDIVNDILDFSKIESERMSLDIVNFDFNELVNSVVSTFKYITDEKGIYLELKKSDLVPKYLQGDVLKIKQVLINIIGNAVKFTKKGGVTLKIDVDENLDFKDYAEVLSINFKIIDTGIGIESDKIENIFDSFAQADFSITRKFGGSGLGLTISKNLIEMMGGTLGVESKVNSGSTFCFMFKLKVGRDDSLTKQNKKRIVEKHNNCFKILFAEDDRINEKVMTIVLKRLGHEVVVVRNGIDVIKKLKDERFDLIFMDIEMPEMDGIEAIEHIRNGRAGSINRNIAIIALTAHAGNEIKNRCTTLGVKEFLTKPVKIDEIDDIIYRAITL